MNCLVEECMRPAFARGWCEKHYQRWYRNGDPLAVKQRSGGGHPPVANAEDVLRAIQAFYTNEGYPPTIRELGELCGYRRHENVSYWLDKLREEGKVDWVDGKARTLRVLEGAQ